MSTAEVVTFPVSEVTKVADLDNGYTRIANDLLEAFYSLNLTERQFKIVMFIMRKTYGFNKKTDYIANTQIADAINVHHTHVCKSKNDLIDRNILKLDGRKIGINKNIAEWILAKSANSSQISKELAKPANKTLAKSANAHYPNQLNTKDNITKDKKDNNILLDSAFEIFYKAGLQKLGRAKAIPSFKSAYKNWKSDNKTPEAFATMLANDIQCRLKANIFGFVNLHPTTYLNQMRWEDELPATAKPKQSQMTPEQQKEYDMYMFMRGED